MKRFVTILAALSIGACQIPAISIGGPEAPAPLAQTTIDDTALMTAWKSFDIALDAINMLIDAKQITIGSPKAVKVADGIDRVTAFLTAAESAAAAGSTKDYMVALANAKGAITDLRAALKGS